MARAIEDEKVGTDLLKNGKLKKRVTIIPLNKINAFRASAQKLTAAKKIGGEKVNLALSLVGYEKDVANAMAFVFGDTLICDDAESAKAVTFNPAVGLKSVTLDGDVYDPSGTLSGGSAPNSNGILLRVQELNEAERVLRDAKDALRKLEKEEDKSRAVRDAWKGLTRELEIKEHEVKLMDTQLGGSNAARVRVHYALFTVVIDSYSSLRSAKRSQPSNPPSLTSTPASNHVNRNKPTLKPNARSSKRTWTTSRITKKARSSSLKDRYRSRRRSCRSSRWW